MAQRMSQNESLKHLEGGHEETPYQSVFRMQLNKCLEGSSCPENAYLEKWKGRKWESSYPGVHLRKLEGNGRVNPKKEEGIKQ